MRERHPDGGSARKAGVCGQDADDCCERAINPDGVADYRPIAAVAQPPRGLREESNQR